MENIGINLPLLLAFLINFVILFVLLGIFLYKPALKMLDQRQAKIRESMEQTELIKQQAARAEEQVREQLESARKEGQTMIAQSAQMGEKLKGEARGEARREAELLIARAQDEIKRQSDEAINELRKEFVDIAITAAEKVIDETLDKSKHRHLIEEVLEKDTTFGKN